MSSKALRRKRKYGLLAAHEIEQAGVALSHDLDPSSAYASLGKSYNGCQIGDIVVPYIDGGPAPALVVELLRHKNDIACIVAWMKGLHELPRRRKRQRAKSISELSIPTGTNVVTTHFQLFTLSQLVPQTECDPRFTLDLELAYNYATGDLVQVCANANGSIDNAVQWRRSTRASSRCHFLQLPAETRDQIYQYVFENQRNVEDDCIRIHELELSRRTCENCTGTCLCPLGDPKDCLRDSQFIHNHQRRIASEAALCSRRRLFGSTPTKPAPLLLVEIMRTCSAIAQEATTALLRMKTFVMLVCGNATTFQIYGTRYPPLDTIRCLRIEIQLKFRTVESGLRLLPKQAVKSLEIVARNLKLTKKLIRLQIDFTVLHGHQDQSNSSPILYLDLEKLLPRWIWFLRASTRLDITWGPTETQKLHGDFYGQGYLSPMLLNQASSMHYNQAPLKHTKLLRWLAGLL